MFRPNLQPIHRQLGSSWDQIAKITEENVNLAVVKLNCEGPKENEQVCSEVYLDVYTTTNLTIQLVFDSS